MISSQPAYRAIRKKLFISCASVAIATAAIAPQKARAQAAPGAFQGNPTTGSGTVVYSRDSSPVIGSETITIGTDTATINWSPYDTAVGTTDPINFLPSGDTATFTSTSGLTDYTVLNRIVPTDPNRAIELNGSIISTLEGGSTTGGKIWFYSPGGILIGSGAVIDVGSLLLTTADPNSWGVNPDGSFNVTFGEGETATNPNSKISIADTATIHALQKNSYIALIAPRIEQAGTVEVNGSAAYIAGEAMTMSFSQGLFDVSVDVGTGDVNGIVHTGTTGGPANEAASDNHTIYMAAVPKNQAMTMLLSGNIGFDAATSASVQNGQIMLSAGWSPAIGDAGEPEFQTFHTDSDAGMRIFDADLTSSVRALANSDINAQASDQDLTFEGDLQLESFNGNVALSASGNRTLHVGGNLNLYAFEGTGAQEIDIDAFDGGIVEVTGDVYLDVGRSGVSHVYSTGVFAGTVNIDANGGTISTGNLSINAIATGNPDPYFSPIQYAQGGNVNITAENGGGITVNGDLSAIADATGGNLTFGSSAAGAGFGGYVTLSFDNGSLDVKGNTYLSASGFGGDYTGGGSPPVSAGGSGYGGTITIEAFDDGSFDTEDLDVFAQGIGGDGYGYGGNGSGGDISVDAELGGQIKPTGEVSLFAQGLGGDVIGDAAFSGYGTTFTSQFAGFGSGGDVSVTVNDGIIDIGGALTISAIGFGGNIAGAATYGFGGGGSGGDIDVSSDGGSITVKDATNLVADGSGGDGTDGGHASGGRAGITAFDGTIALGPSTYVSARGNGGDATVGFGGYGGSGIGGEAFIEALSNPGNVDLPAESGTITGGDVIIDASGTGGAGGAGNGDNFAPGAGGDGFGGVGCGECGHSPGAYVIVDGTATLSLGNVQVLSEGYGGSGGTGVNGQTGGTGGFGYGGYSSVTYTDQFQQGVGAGSMGFGDLEIRARGIGGDGGLSDSGTLGDGGFGQGGFVALGTYVGLLAMDELDLNAQGIGGYGGNGGLGIGGYAFLGAYSGGEVSVTGDAN